MSSPSALPENAAAAAAVSPLRPADDAVLDALPPRPPAGVTQEQSPDSSVSPSPPSEAPSPPGQQGTLGTNPKAAPATVIAAASHADPLKYARGPAVLQRPHGLSLLTQALATARGIPRQNHIDLSHAKSHPTAPVHRSPEPHELATADPEARDSRHGSRRQSDGDPLTPRLPPRNPMASTTSTSTAVYSGLDIDDVNSMLNGHREFLAKTKSSRGLPDEVIERDRPSRWRTYSYDKSTGNSSLTSPLLSGSPTSMHDEAAGGNTGTDGHPHSRVWKPDHRMSMGPEKAWSIGSGDAANGQDGQVEKSITEVLARVEPNARSRKASHSLRFFREGLPEEKGRRKDTRAATQHTRETSPAKEERLGGIEHQSMGGETGKGKVQGLQDSALSTERRHRPRALTPKTSEGKAVHPSEDYVTQRDDEIVRDGAAKSELLGHHTADQKQPVPESAEPCRELQSRRVSDVSVEAGECVEEGDESGEEKISSAVFLPHQAPDESQDHPPGPGAPQRAVLSRRHSRPDDFHPWLVKADEPEVDHKRESIDYERDVSSEAAESVANVAPEVAFRQVAEPTAVDESEAGVRSPRPFRPVSQYYEEAVHEHQLTPKQPLEAIELIPYKHQVGGHTTLWRFSRRAVCKQLNNRENEFYEKVEKYHRDLLAFLPRYIGVLNVTFQKQPRRRSTMKRDDAAASERSYASVHEPGANSRSNGTGLGETVQQCRDSPPPDRPRIVSQSLQSSSGPIPTVTFVDNKHILPRNLLQPMASLAAVAGRFRSASASAQELGLNGQDGRYADRLEDPSRPTLQDRHANSWGATTVNKKLRNEVFNDAFLKQPIAIHRHRKAHQRSVPPRRTLQQVLRPSGSDPNLIESHEKRHGRAGSAGEEQQRPAKLNGSSPSHSQSEPGQTNGYCEGDGAPEDVTGTSAPEPQILGGSSPAQKRKRRYSGSGLRRKPKDVQDGRGDLQYFEEADDAGYKGDHEDTTPVETFKAPSPERADDGQDSQTNGGPTEILAPPEFKKIPRPVNPKEAQTQRDSRVEYFLLLEDLTAGMKRPCIMDLKMGTRQYGVDANAKKQQSQQGKCAKTTSRDLGVRVCGLQVWDAQTQSYVFKDKYYGRGLKAGAEFQQALTRFLYDGVDRASILRHIPTVLRKLDELEVIIERLRGYRFYAASLLMFYDGDAAADDRDSSSGNGNGNMAYVEDSTTDFATDTEDLVVAPSHNARPTRRSRRREIDFKMADFANCVTGGDAARDKPCPPKHPDEPDRGFLRGLRSLRRCFLKIQRDTREEMGLVLQPRGDDGAADEELSSFLEEEEEGSVSE